MIPDRERDAGDIYISLASYRARRRVEDLLGKLPWLCAFRRGKGGACARIAEADLVAGRGDSRSHTLHALPGVDTKR